MVVDVTDVFRNHRDSFDQETWDRILLDEPALKFSGLRMSRSTADSMTINEADPPVIIMSTSGMCTAGRIKHHLRHNIGNSRNTILFVGYQVHGTLGRQIVDGREQVRIHGKTHDVKARVAQIHGFSGHADRSGLLCWANAFHQPPHRAFLTRGEGDSAHNLAQELRQTYQWPVSIPHYQSVYDLD